MAFGGVYYLKEGSLLRKLPSFSEKIPTSGQRVEVVMARLLNPYVWVACRGGDGGRGFLEPGVIVEKDYPKPISQEIIPGSP